MHHYMFYLCKSRFDSIVNSFGNVVGIIQAHITVCADFDIYIDSVSENTGLQEINLYYNPKYGNFVRLTEMNSAVAYNMGDVLVSDFAVTSDKKQIKGIGIAEADYDENGKQLYDTNDPWKLINK